MRTPTLLAATAASVLSLGLMLPAQAATDGHIAGRASCTGGGTIRVGGSVDQDGNATAVAHLWGTDRKRWGGAVMAGLDDHSMDDLSDDDVQNMVHKYVADDGELTVVAKQSGATTPNAMAAFMTPSLGKICMATVAHEGKQYVVSGMLEGLAVANGERQAVAAFAMGEENHRYRARFTLTGKGGHVQTRVLEHTVEHGQFGVDLTVRDFKRLSSFKRISVRIVDLTNHKAKPASYAIVR